MTEITDFWSQYRKQAGSMLYRYEYDGIVVYDSLARFSDQELNWFPLETRKVRSSVLRDLDTVAAFGKSYIDKHQFSQMKNYPSFKPALAEYTLVAPSDRTLKFDSRFESGNLRKAIKVSEKDYTLLLDFDVETQGYTQWFYFAVEPFRANQTVRFSIINLMKYESLYNNGLQPLVFTRSKGWHRSGSCISYFKNRYTRQTTSNNSRLPQHYYTLTFTYTFEEVSQVYFAHCYPYTYSDLQKYIADCAMRSPGIFRSDVLCKTLAGNECYVVTITENAHTWPWEKEKAKLSKSAAGRRLIKLRELKSVKKKQTDEHSYKKTVVLTARVHPGESNSSFMMKGAMDFLLGQSKEACLLRKHFVFKIVPMINPDGVVYGNYRCSLLGVDLNRRWKNPHAKLHPTVFYTKKLMQIMSEDSEVVMYCDMHGHSIKREVFMYACAEKEIDKMKSNMLIKLIPFFLAKTNPLFSFKNSHFRLEKYKESTARIVTFKEFSLLNSFTLEASFYGPNGHLSTAELESIGKDLLRQLFMFLSPSLFYKKLNYMLDYFKRKIAAKKNNEENSEKPQKVCLTEENNLEEEKNQNKYISSCKNIDTKRKRNQILPNFDEVLDIQGDLDEIEAEEMSGLLNNKDTLFGKFDINQAIEGINAEQLEGIELSEEDSDSCGSDSCASDNDDRKLQFLQNSEKKPTKKTSIKRISSSISSRAGAESPPKPTNRSLNDFKGKQLSFKPLRAQQKIYQNSDYCEEELHTKTTEQSRLYPLCKREQHKGFIITSVARQSASNPRNFVKNKYQIPREQTRRSSRIEQKTPKFLITNFSNLNK